MYDDILVPTDGSDAALAAVEHALDLADDHGATVHALYVVEPVYTAEYGGQGVLEALEGAGKEAVGMVADRADERGVAVETAVVVGTPHREILAYATDTGVDLVVLGTHGRTGLDRYLLGSVTEKVVRLSDVPVLTVRSRPEEA